MDTYEKKLALAKEALDSGSYDKETIEYIFPELKENEDENIRKTLIDFFNRGAENGAQTNGVCDKDIIAWLEKQGEQVSAIRWYDASFIPQEYKELLVEWNSSDTTWHDVAFYHADTKTFKSYESELKNVTRWCYVEDLYWEQSNVKETGISQHDKKTCVEWSEEDNQIALSIEQVMNCASLLNIVPEKIDKIKTWLKSLKQRYTWKPSDEQIEAFEHLVRSVGESGYAPPYDNNTKLLYSILSDLEKLKGE